MDDGNRNKILSKETFVANKDWCYERKYAREKSELTSNEFLVVETFHSSFAIKGKFLFFNTFLAYFFPARYYRIASNNEPHLLS